jgi:hypothetical protein
MHWISGRLELIHFRTTIGGGKASSWVEAVPSGCLSIVSGTMLLDCISKGSYPACVVYGLLTGTVGFLTAYAFVRRLYRQVYLSRLPMQDRGC